MKYKYDISNLECGNCAKKIEDKLNRDPNFKNVIVNFNTSKLIYESDIPHHKSKAIEIIKSLEPDVEIAPEVNAKNNKFSINKTSLAILIIGLIIGISSLLVSGYISNILIIISYVLLLTKVFVKAIKILIKSHSLDENMLITISVIGAYLIGDSFEGFMVIGLYAIGKLLEEIAVNKSRKNIAELMDIRPEYANKIIDGNIEVVDPTKIKTGDSIIVKVGECIPLDGIIISGNTHLDTSALTGESEPVSKSLEDLVLSGSINLTNQIEVKVTEKYEDSTVSRILDLVENATNRKAETENFVSRAAKVYTPIVIILSILTFLILPLFGIDTDVAIYRALSFLVISCPCAIAISVPLSYFSGIGIASKKGILFKGSDYLDNIRNIKTIVFDKTGTLTTGKFSVVDIISYNDYSKEEILYLCCLGENTSNHPIAKAILKYYGKQVDNNLISNHKEVAGKGIEFTYKNNIYKIGNGKYMDSSDLDTTTAVYVSKNDKLIGKILIDDEIKEKTASTIKYLHDNGIKTIMLTGDNKSKASKVSEYCGIDEYHAQLLPQDKYDIVNDKLKNKNGLLAFVGDGINDAPVLGLSDIGISMGGIGSSSAIEASDIVIMNDSLDKIIEGINISKYTAKIIKQNLIFSIGIKLLFIILNLFGYSTMFLAVFADVGVTVLAILNSIRILKIQII